MNTRKISKLANELIMDELLGTNQNDESNFPKDILDELEFAFQDCQRKVDQLHDDPHALANLGVIDHAGRSGHHCPTALPDADLFGRRLILSSFPLPDIIDIFTQMLVTFRVVHSSEH